MTRCYVVVLRLAEPTTETHARSAVTSLLTDAATRTHHQNVHITTTSTSAFLTTWISVLDAHPDTTETYLGTLSTLLDASSAWHVVTLH